MSIIDGVLMNGTRIVIPSSLKDDYLRCLHTGHFGISKCQARTECTVCWPAIDKDITNLIGRCDTYKQVQHAPAHIYGSDIASIDGKPHVVIIDYYSF